MRTYRFEKDRLFFEEIHGKVCRKSPIYYKTIRGVIYECYYDPEKAEKKTHKRQRCRDFMRWATAIAKLDYDKCPWEREKYEREFEAQERYHQLFHYIVACHKLALERTLIARKPNRREVEWAMAGFEDIGLRTKDGMSILRDGEMGVMGGDARRSGGGCMMRRGDAREMGRFSDPPLRSDQRTVPFPLIASAMRSPSMAEEVMPPA